MNAGDRDRRITIQRVTGTTIGAAGTPIQTWGDVATRWAQLVSRSTREFIQGGAVDEERVVFRIQPLAGVSNADRIIYDGRIFNIREVEPIGRGVGLELRAVGLRPES